MELRETERFALFNRGTSLQTHADCPFDPQVRNACNAIVNQQRKQAVVEQAADAARGSSR